MLPENVGYAAAICHNPETGETLYTAFRTDEGEENPVAAARAIRVSCADDFPDCLWNIVSNHKANAINSDFIWNELSK